MSAHFFNPRAIPEPEFLANFVARHENLSYFLKGFLQLSPEQTAQHHLIIAPRGFGKTSLLRRIAIALKTDKAYSAHFIPFSFREEQHNVISLDVFWQNCLQSLHETLEDEHYDADELDALEDIIDHYAPRKELKKEAQDGAPAEEKVMSYCAHFARRPVLLIDNLASFLEGLPEQHQWRLRSSLQAANGPVLIAASARYPESLSDSSAAFFDYFRIHTLSRLSDDEVMRCLREFAHTRGETGKQVLQQIDREPGKIITLNTLAGGNPRTLRVLYSILEEQMQSDSMQQLTAMLDRFTGWYQARTEELPLQARAIFDAVALHWDPITATDLTTVSGMEVQTVSSQLSRLEKLGYVEPVKQQSDGKGRNAYQVTERFYNIWYLMRHGNRRLEKQVKFLTVFIEAMYTSIEKNELARRMLTSAQGLYTDPAPFYAMAKSVSGAMSQELLARAKQYDTSLAAESQEADSKTKDKSLIGDQVKALFQQAYELKFQGQYTKAEAVYRKIIELSPKHEHAWSYLGNLLMNHLGRYEEAETAYREQIKYHPKHEHAWNSLGNLLQDHLGHYEEAEAAYLQHLAHSARKGFAYGNLAYLYQLRLDRHKETLAHIESAKQSGQLSETGLLLLEGLSACTMHDFNFDAVWRPLLSVIANDHQDLYINYIDDLQRILAWLLAKGHGPLLHTRMDEAKFSERYAPLYHAILAVMQGKDHLLTINPETRSISERFYPALYRMLKSYPEGKRFPD